MPEKIQSKNHKEIDRDIEMLKAKATLIQSNVNDLNEEVCKNFIFFLLKLIFNIELFKIKICRVEVDDLLSLKSDLVKKDLNFFLN